MLIINKYINKIINFRLDIAANTNSMLLNTSMQLIQIEKND